MKISNSTNTFTLIRMRLILEREKISSYSKMDPRTVENRYARNRSPKKQSLKRVISLMPDIKDSILLPPQYTQEKLSRKAKLALQKGECTAEILRTVDAAFDTTQISENSYIGMPLLAFEPELFHTMAKLYVRDGNMQKGIVMLKNVLQGVSKYPPDDETYERQIAPLMLTLAQLQMQAGDNSGAVKTCDDGFDMACRRAHGRHCPEFIHFAEHAKVDKCRIQLLKACAGYAALNNGKAFYQVLEIARHNGIVLETHGMDTLIDSTAFDADIDCESNLPASVTEQLNIKPQKYNTLGSLITLFQKHSGLDATEICRGICSNATFTRLTTSDLESPALATVEAVIQRMGMDMGSLYTFQAPAWEFDTWQLKDKIMVLTRARKYNDATELLEQLKTLEQKKRHKSNAMKQFILAAEATIFGAKNGNDPMYLQMLQDAIAVTVANFDDSKITRCPMSVREAVIINQMAMYYDAVGESVRAAKIYDDLLRNIEARWVAKKLKSHMYATVSFNYSSCLGRMGKRPAAMYIIDRALQYGQPRGDLIGLFALFFNKAYNMLMLGSKDESLPYFALAYYGFLLFEKHRYAKYAEIASRVLKEHFNICT